MPVMEGAALAAAISAIGTTITNIFMSQQQKQYNEQMQDKQNQYNSPSAQLERLKSAGVSPNSLTMGNGSVVTGNQSAPLNPYQLPNVQDPMSMITNSMLSAAQGQTENEMRELRKFEAAAQIQTLEANLKKIGVETEYQSILNTFAAAKERAAIVGQQFQNKLTWYQTNKVRQEAKNLVYQLEQIFPEELKKLVSETKLNASQLDLLVEQIAKLKAETANIEQTTEQSEAQEQLIQAQTEQQQKETSQYDKLTEKILAQYQATINKLSEETNLTHEQAYYYLYELCRKYGIKFFGVPLPGQGGVREIDLQKGISDDAIDKYGVSSFYGN